jgi:hypothetical protein
LLQNETSILNHFLKEYNKEEQGRLIDIAKKHQHEQIEFK